jgi:hypothetical protein
MARRCLLFAELWVDNRPTGLLGSLVSLLRLVDFFLEYSVFSEEIHTYQETYWEINPMGIGIPREMSKLN